MGGSSSSVVGCCRGRCDDSNSGRLGEESGLFGIDQLNALSSDKPLHNTASAAIAEHGRENLLGNFEPTVSERSATKSKDNGRIRWSKNDDNYSTSEEYENSINGEESEFTCAEESAATASCADETTLTGDFTDSFAVGATDEHPHSARKRGSLSSNLRGSRSSTFQRAASLQIHKRPSCMLPHGLFNVDNHERRRSFSAMMGTVKSSAMQMVIDNPRDINVLYDIQKTNVIKKDDLGTLVTGTVKATGAMRAIKVVPKANMQLEKRKDVAKEIDILRMLDHPNIVLLREIFEDTINVFLVFEHCPGGTLKARLNSGSRFTEVTAAIVMHQVLRAVFYLHAKRICHRDLTPRNVMIGSPEELISVNTLFKVCGFESACRFKQGGRLRREKGTISHRAPEVSTKSYTQACDLWSCGVIMFQVLCGGQLPFPKGVDNTRSTVVPQKGESWNNVSQGAKDLVGLLLEQDAVARYTAEQALHHKWLYKAVPKLTHVPLHAELVHNLRSFRSLNKFKKAALLVVASMLNQSETSVPRKFFHLADSDGDGLINETEMMEQIQKANIKMDFEMQMMFKDSESTDPGSVKDFGYTEFLAATFDRKQCLREDVLWSAFKCFDQNGDANISFTELATGQFLDELSLEELGQILEEVDFNRDSQIDFKEFKSLMLSGNSTN